MTSPSWALSGHGECPLSLQDAQQLAVEACFTFKGANEAMPLARRADLQAMFDHFGVNSLTAFRRKFWAYELNPSGPPTSSHTAAPSAAHPTPLSLPAAARSHTGMPPLPSCSGSSSRSRWGVQQQGSETYVGELLDGRRHGSGILLSKGARSWVLHVGRFSEGKRNGPGVVATSRGERFEGFFMDDLMWGPGQYTYAPPAPTAGPPAPAPAPHGTAAAHRGSSSQGGSSGSRGSGCSSSSMVDEVAGLQGDVAEAPSGTAAGAPKQEQGQQLRQEEQQQEQPQGQEQEQEQQGQQLEQEGQGQQQQEEEGQGQQQQGGQGQQQPHRVWFRGMMNGRPQGKGCLEWSDGSRQVGLFDGSNCYLRLREEEVAGVLMVAGDNASEARAVAAEVQQAAGRQQQDIAQHSCQLFASLAPPGHGMGVPGGQPGPGVEG